MPISYSFGREFQERLSILLEDAQMAEQLYKQAIALDPNFALAHARLAHTVANIYHEFQPTKARETEARNEAREALRLQPGLGEAHLALGLCHLWIDADYGRALAEFELASRTMPNNAEIPGCVGAVRRRQGRWREALAKFEEAAAIDPRNEHTVANLGDTYAHVRDWAASARSWDRAQTISPALIYKVLRGYVDIWWKGNTGLLKSVLAEVPAGVDPNGLATFTRWDLALLERDFAAAERALTASRFELIPAVYSGGGPPLPKSYLRGCIELARGDDARAQPFFEAARAHFQAEVNASPEDAVRHAYLGLLYAHMGKKEDAIREGWRACELKPESTDAISGTWMTAFMALIYARVGEADLALPLIEHCLTRPGVFDNFEESITLGDLKLRWGWDPIRGDARFQKLLANPEQNSLQR
jgi:tetratricopeptide (TPR) repeat protein